MFASFLFVWAYNGNCLSINLFGGCDTESQTLPLIFSSNLVGLQNGHYNVYEPKTGKESKGCFSAVIRTAKFTSDLPSSDEQTNNAGKGADDEYDDTEAETASRHEVVCTVLGRFVYASNKPW